MRSRCAVAAATLGLALLGALLPAAPAAAAGPVPPPPVVVPVAVECTAHASFATSASGEFAATVTAIVVGHCRGAEWVTCDVTLVGANRVVGTNRDAGLTDCRVELTFQGLQKTAYLNLGQVGYTASYPTYLYSDVATTVP
jgi:hypothetical protein